METQKAKEIRRYEWISTHFIGRGGKIRATKCQCEFYCALLCLSINILLYTVIPKTRAFNSVAKYSNVWNSNNHTFCKPRGTVEVIHISHLKYIYGITGVSTKICQNCPGAFTKICAIYLFL